MTTWKDTPTRKIDVDGVDVRLPRTRHRLRRSGGVPAPPDRGPRRLGPARHRRHRRAPPRDRLRQPRRRRDRRVGPTTVEQMGADAIAFIRALGLEQVDLFGFSLGGGVAQMVALQAPDLVRRMILAGTGPRGGGGIDKMATIVGQRLRQGSSDFQRPQELPVLPPHPRRQDGPHRTTSGDSRNAPRTATRRSPSQARIAQIKAIRHAGLSQPDDLSRHHPARLRRQRRP